MNSSIELILADASISMLVGWWMALLMFVTFIPWAWLVSSKLDKDAEFFHLNRRMWNGIHIGAGAAALLAMLLIPLPGVNWLAGVIILLAPVVAYWRVRNSQVPEDQQFHLTSESLKTRVAARKAAKASRDAAIQFTDPHGNKRPIPPREEPRFAIHMLAEDLIGPALEARASRLDIKVTKSGATVVQVVDGVAYRRDPIPTEQALPLVDYLKDTAGMDIEDRRRQQKSAFKLFGPAGNVEVHALTQGSSSGLALRLQFDRTRRLKVPFDSLGLLPSQKEALQVVEDRSERHGIVLVGSPPGHGLTTTMYSLLAHHDAYTCNIKTLEREIEREINGVDHTEWDPTNKDVDYSTNLQSILRRDPDIVMLSYITDAQTAQVVTDPGMEGPLLYIPQRAANIPDQIRDWVKVCGDVKRATAALRLVMNQRLVRRLCEVCRQPYNPTPEQLKKLNLAPDKVGQFYRASGQVLVKNKMEPCSTCTGTGYSGLVGVFEVMTIDHEARKLLVAGDLKGALAHARRQKMIYLQEAALRKVVEGTTSIDEVMRVTAPGKRKAPSQQQQRPEPQPEPAA